MILNPLLSVIKEMAKDFFVNKKNKTDLITTKYSKDYQRFVEVADIPSLGRFHRVFGRKTKRTHHLLSDLEIAVFLLFEWRNNTEDIQINRRCKLNIARI